MRSRRRLTLFIPVSCGAMAQRYPARPIRVLIPFFDFRRALFLLSVAWMTGMTAHDAGAQIAANQMLLAASPKSPFTTVQEVITYARQNPGKLLNASSGNGSPGHVGFELFKFMAGVPKPIITRLNAEINKALASDTIKQRFAAIGAEPTPRTPRQFSDLIRSEHAKWGDVIRRSGARID